MVAVKGSIATAVAAGGLDNKQGNGMIDGRVKAMIDSYTTDGTEVVGSTITMGQVLPAGAKVVDVQIVNEALGSSVTLDVGDSNDAARYLNDYDANGSLRGELNLAAGAGYEIGTVSGDNQLILTVAGATLTAAKKIKTVFYYTMD